MVCRQGMIASPVAVRSSSLRPAMAAAAAARSVVGGTSTVAVPAKDTTPRLIPGGRSCTNRVAACCAAANRFGVTSVACMDNDTSMASITVARSRGCRACAVGPAIATVSNANPTSTTTAGTCRHRPGGERGATRSRTSSRRGSGSSGPGARRHPRAGYRADVTAAAADHQRPPRVYPVGSDSPAGGGTGSVHPFRAVASPSDTPTPRKHRARRRVGVRAVVGAGDEFGMGGGLWAGRPTCAAELDPVVCGSERQQLVGGRAPRSAGSRPRSPG